MKKNIILVLSFSIFLVTSVFAQEKNYFVSATGNDNNSGLSKQQAWRSVDKINTINFKAGDSILFEGGAFFKGTIKLTSDDSGTSDKPVVFTSYGKGKASINAGDGDGLLAINTSFLKIISINFEGSGVDQNKGTGIHFFANDSVNAPSHIEIADCTTKGFRIFGIGFGANDNISYKGYDEVRITHCNASENGQAGIASYGSQLGFQHKNFYIAYCKAFGNRGILSNTQSHSGNGIVMGMTDGLMIEYCEAFENGADNRCEAGGPVGIWVWMCKNAIIQHCTSHNNYAGATKDGGGFDIDGGASNCIIQYNYSYDNEGAGYLLAEYGALFPFTNNIIRFNISADDGRKNNYGSISVWGADSAFSVTNSSIYNNTIYLDDHNVINGTPAAVTFMGPHFKNVVIANNIFVTKGNCNLIRSDTFINRSAAYLLHNNYYSYSNKYNFAYGSTSVSSLQQWLTINNEQERTGNKMVGTNIDPMFTGGSFITSGKEAFELQRRSPLRKVRFVLSDLFDLTNEVSDIEGEALPQNRKVFPGAFIK